MLSAALLSTASAFAPRAATTRAFSRATQALMANPKVYFDMEVGGDEVGRSVCVVMNPFPSIYGI